MAHTKQPKQFGELMLAFTNEFEGVWGRKSRGYFYRPKSFKLEGYDFRPLGNSPFPSWALLVAPADGYELALKEPDFYEQIWTDRGSGYGNDGSCWRLGSEDSNYVALGDVVVSGWDSPSGEDAKLWMVRQDLTTRGVVGLQGWSDRKSGAKKDFTAWAITSPPDYSHGRKSNQGAIGANTFLGVNSYNKPPNSEKVCRVLALPFPAWKTPILPPDPPKPSEHNKPEPYVDNSVVVPFTAIRDPLLPMENSLDELVLHPWYRIERLLWWKEILKYQNRGNDSETRKVTVTIGLSRTKEEEFTKETSVSISVTVGVKASRQFGSVGGEAWVETSYTATETLGWREATSVTTSTEMVVEQEYVIEPHTWEAYYVRNYRVQVLRDGDDTLVQSTPTWEMNEYANTEEDIPSPNPVNYSNS